MSVNHSIPQGHLGNWHNALTRGLLGVVALLVLLASYPPALAQASSLTESNTAFNVEAATRAYLDRLTPEKKQRSDAYFEGGYWLQLWEFLYGIGVAVMLLNTRLSARMRDLAGRVTRFKALHTIAYWFQYLLVTLALTFPLTVYEGFFREHQYGMSNQSFGGWLGDFLKGLMVALVLEFGVQSRQESRIKREIPPQRQGGLPEGARLRGKPQEIAKPDRRKAFGAVYAYN